MIFEADTMFGWTLDQYLVAYVWVQAQGEKKREMLDNTTEDVEFFSGIQALWDEAHHSPPLTGAYKLYDPEISSDTDFFLRVKWMNVRYTHDNDPWRRLA